MGSERRVTTTAEQQGKASEKHGRKREAKRENTKRVSETDRPGWFPLLEERRNKYDS